MNSIMPNPEEIRSTWRFLAHARFGVAEVRVIRPLGGIVGIGFFDNEEDFVKECIRTNPGGNVYVGIQPRPKRFLELAQNVVRPIKQGASNKDIEIITGTVIDIDPVRPKNVASTDAELALAMDAAEKAKVWCQSEGLEAPKLMMSGNGAQLWFALPPTDITIGDKTLQEGLKRFESDIRAHVQSDAVHVDSIHDVARIIKVIGTVSYKGDGLGDRPHRVSAAVSGFLRIEDPKLLLRIKTTPELSNATTQKQSLSQTGYESTAKACRKPDDTYDYEHPVDMCDPFKTLWQQGHKDRSLAIFNMVRYFIYKGFGLLEITDLILEYDRRGLGKLNGRDGAAYVKQAYDKIKSQAQNDGKVAPPCHSLQKMGFCKLGHEPDAHCEHYNFIFDVEKAILAIPTDAAAGDLESRLKPILEAISYRNPSIHSKYLGLIEKRFALKAKDLRKAMALVVTSWSNDTFQKHDDIMEGEIFEDTCFYYCMNGDEAKVVSSFTIHPSMRVTSDDGEFIFGDAITDKGTTVPNLRLPISSFHSKRDFMKHLPSVDLQWTGNDNNVQGLLRILANRQIPNTRGSNMLGDYCQDGHHVWLGPDCAIGKQGFFETSPVIYLKNGASLDKRVRYQQTDEDTFLKIATTVFRFLPQVNKPEVILPILGWFFATPMKARLMKTMGSFPSLFVWGTQGSGKSSLCTDIMWPLFGVRDAEPYSATETEFALLKLLSSTSTVPVFIDEYKPYDMQRQKLNTLHRCLRRVYRGETEERGRPDLRINSYNLQAPLCIAGETRPTEAALLERIITANLDKTAIEQSPIYKQAFCELRASNLALFAPRYIQFCMGRDLTVDLQIARQIAMMLFKGRKIPLRIAENITTMLLGIHLFEEFASACGCEIPEELSVKKAVDAVLADVIETDYGVKNALDHFLEMLGVMAVQGELRYGVHYTYVDGHLALHLETSYDAFRTHCKRMDYEGEIIGIKPMRRIIIENKKQNGYVIAESERVVFSYEGRRRAVLVDLSKTDVVSADDFPKSHDIEQRALQWRRDWNEPS